MCTRARKLPTRHTRGHRTHAPTPALVLRVALPVPHRVLVAPPLPPLVIGGRAAHDHSLVAAGDWREFALFGNGKKIERNCARCPVTTSIIEQAIYQLSHN